MVIVPNITWQASIDKAKDNSQDQLLECGRESLIFCQNNVVPPHYNIPLLLQIRNDQVPVLVVELYGAGIMLIVKAEEVKEMHFLLLEILLIIHFDFD